MARTALILWLLYNASAPTGLIVLGWICFVAKTIEWLKIYVF